MPTRLTASVWSCEAVCARLVTDSMSRNRLLSHRRIVLRLSRPLGASPRHPDFARHQTDEGPHDKHVEAHPDPGHQREDVSLDHRLGAVVGHAGEIQIEVLVEPPPDGYLRGPLL